ITTFNASSDSCILLANASSNNLRNELEKYLLLPLEDNSNLLVWWQVQKDYPALSLIARDYLSIQATSMASEQAFSVAGLTISNKRNRLDDKSARAILCLKSWLQKEICTLDN
ncbi:25842_t:CDS:1, partial [Racocetra persica]